MTETPASDIVEAVADSNDCEPAELELVLGDYVDLDALNRLAEHADSTWTFTFELPKSSVTVTSDGTVAVDEASEADPMA